MAECSQNTAAHLDANLLVRKGEARPTAPSSEPNPPQDTAPLLPKGGKNSIALTVRLDLQRYQRLVAYGARFAPRRSNQDILVTALDTYLDQVEEL